MKQLKYINRWFDQKENQKLLLLFFAWRIWIFVFAVLGVIFLSSRNLSFLGGGAENYFENPLFWGWANFDGVNYLSIAQRGYGSEIFQHSFFPFYPILMRLLAVDSSLLSLSISGLLIANLSFVASIFFLWKLLKLDYPKRVVLLSICSLIFFPTSFFFGSLYTESLFLLLTLASFYFARRGNWFIAGFAGFLAAGTRIYGILLLPALLVEWFGQNKTNKEPIKYLSMLPLLLIPLGLISYMWFLYKTTGNPLSFYTELSIFGEQREGKFILLYQVFWRYAKMLFTVTRSDPLYLTVLLEAATSVFALLLIVWGILKKLRPSYLTYALLGYILPTLTGSFSSFPRYILVLFPVFIMLGLFLSERGKIVRLLIFVIFTALLVIETMLFIRGYWVA